MSRLVFASWMVLVVASSPLVSATHRVVDPVSLQTALNSSVEGDEILLAAGTYPGRFVGIGLTGVTIRSEDAANPAVINAANRGEGLKFVSVTDLTVVDLVIDGANLQAINIDDGGTDAASVGITLRNLEIRNGTGHGIKFAGVEDFHIDRVRINGWGGGSVGVNLIGAHDGVVERSVFHNTSTGGGAGIQAKGGSSDVVLRANRLINANERSIQIGGATGLNSFRPQPPGDVEASNIIAEGNVILSEDNLPGPPPIRSAVSYVNVREGTFRNNVVVRPRGYVLRALKENRQPGFVDTQGGQFLDNVVIWNQGDLWGTVNRGSSTLPETFLFEGNHWFNATRPTNSFPDLPSVETGGTYGVDPGIALDATIDWSFDWGKWLVNTTETDQTFSLEAGESLFLASPGAGATFDIGRESPLLGDWTLTPAPHEVPVTGLSYVLLLNSHPADLNQDGDIEAGDIDLLSQAVSDGSTDLRFDLNGDGFVDSADRTTWVESLVGTFFGDADLNRAVEFQDFTALANGFGQSGSWGSGDFTGDGVVGFPDFVLLSDNFGRSAALTTLAVPAPTSNALATVVLAWFFLGARGSRAWLKQ